MKNIILINIILLIVLAYSCNKGIGGDHDNSIYVYKTKQDYSNYVPVELSDDKTKITSNPGDLQKMWPVKLIQGYYLNGTMGVNTGYLSLTIDEYNEHVGTIGIDSLNKLVMERNPYINFYHRNDNDNTFWDENNMEFGIDTTFINELIIRGELERYFKKLK